MGLHTSVKAHINDKRVNLAVETKAEGEILQSFKLMNFRFSEMKATTANFHPDYMLSEGQETGRFYMGWIDKQSLRAAKPGTDMAVAIKKLKVNRRILPGRNEWLTELNCSGLLSHPNLVKLIGYCLERGHNERLLVYEFMPQLSLDKHLLRSDSRDFHCRLSWDLRMKIALGAAKGLAFLHSNEAKVLYGDFRSSKILLDSNYDAKLIGYGLAKVGFEGYRTRVPFVDMYMDERVSVTPLHVYGAPEYGQLTPKNDVYSFGVVLLEILSGKLAYYNKMPRGESDPFWANFVSDKYKMVLSQDFYADKYEVEQIFDAHLEGQYSEDVANKALNLAMHCLSNKPESRPNMNEVVQVLEQLQSS